MKPSSTFIYALVADLKPVIVWWLHVRIKQIAAFRFFELHGYLTVRATNSNTGITAFVTVNHSRKDRRGLKLYFLMKRMADRRGARSALSSLASTRFRVSRLPRTSSQCRGRSRTFDSGGWFACVFSNRL